MNGWLLAYHGAVILLLLVSVVNLASVLATFHQLDPAQKPPATPLVSILVPARNESRNIIGCVESLLAQDYPNFELLVLDDNSEDDTARKIEACGLAEDHVTRRLLRGMPLPAGWIGKAWACHQLAAAARGEYLIFTDADTVHAPASVSSAMAFAQKTGADLVSPWPRQITRSWGEKLILPLLYVLVGTNYAHALLMYLQKNPALARRLSPSFLRVLGAANGQYLVFKKSAYERIGGHAAIRDHLVEDLALGRAVAARTGEGMRVINCDGMRILTCRMYRSFGEVWEGFTKNMRPAFETSLGAFLLCGVTQASCFLLPFILVFFPLQRSFALIEIALVVFIRVVLAVRFRTSWLSVLFHPLGHFLGMAIGVNSWRRAGRGVTWKERTYATS